VPNCNPLSVIECETPCHKIGVLCQSVLTSELCQINNVQTHTTVYITQKGVSEQGYI